MSSPEKTPTDPRPDHAGPSNTTPDQSSESAATISTTPNIDTDANTDTDTDAQASGLTPNSTQQNMGDGTGIRGDYGDASQTNGLEGDPEQPQTDTELTGS